MMPNEILRSNAKVPNNNYLDGPIDKNPHLDMD